MTGVMKRYSKSRILRFKPWSLMCLGPCLDDGGADFWNWGVVGEWTHKIDLGGGVMARFEDMIPAGHEAVWSCGHTGGAVCAECHRELARKAHELQMEVDRLREQLQQQGDFR